jgi:hypothetical protein
MIMEYEQVLTDRILYNYEAHLLGIGRQDL